MLPVAILAGGLATRLRPLSENTPKALVEIHGEPFISHQLRLLSSRGIERAILCVGYRGEMIRDFVGDGRRYGLDVEYQFDGPALLGTAGAIQNALPLLGEAFFVLYGDSYLPCDYSQVEAAFHVAGKSALMTVFANQGQWDASNIEFAGGRILAYDKELRTDRMRHIDYGLGVFRKSALTRPHSASIRDLATVYQQLLADNDLAAFEVRERFYEIGSYAGIQELSAWLRHNSQIPR
jgi:NDP-sugar pyrophosphorylase family protein